MLYVADNGNAPYGARTNEEVLAFSRRITDFLLAGGVKMVVVACNTATSMAIDTLRELYPEVPFVGLEPAVKPAATGVRVGVMATAVTLRSARYLALRDKYLSGHQVWENPCAGLVPLIEEYGPGSPEIRRYLSELLAPAGPLDTVVLGCTHYPLIAADIAAVLPPGARVIDPSGAAARQVQRLLEKRDLLVATDGQTRYDFLATAGGAPLQRTLRALDQLNRNRRWLVPAVTVSRAAINF